ncbi:MAG: dihydroorotate dehydrogenase electron transfer subunit, partial [Woeseiaceae bacterium]
SRRGTLFVEDATILERRDYPGSQFVLRMRAPRCAGAARAGSFIHLRCDDSIPMRRPLSILRAEPREGWIEVLFKIVGEGLRALGGRSAGETLNLIGPIGRGFENRAARPRALLLGGGVGIPPVLFLAEQMLREGRTAPVLLMASELPFPFELGRSGLACGWLDAGCCATVPALERQGVLVRLASLSGFDGVYGGYVTELARHYLRSLAGAERGETEIFACGPSPMLHAVAALAREFALPCQVSLEEYMACAVGGCAGCTVLVHGADGPAMKRVCVDGPVFDAASVFAGG